MFYSQCILKNRWISSEEMKISRVQTGGVDQCEEACSDLGTECVGWTWNSGNGGCDLFNSLVETQQWTKMTAVTSGIMNYGDCPIWANITTKGRYKFKDKS